MLCSGTGSIKVAPIVLSIIITHLCARHWVTFRIIHWKAFKFTDSQGQAGAGSWMWLQTWTKPKPVPPEAWSCWTRLPSPGEIGKWAPPLLNMLLVRPGHIAQGLPSFHPSSELSSYRVRLKPDAALFSVPGVVPLGIGRYLRRVCGGECTLTFYPK